MPDSPAQKSKNQVVISVIVFIGFMAVIIYAFLPDIKEALNLPSSTKVAGETFESKYFTVTNASQVSPSQVRGVITMLESNYDALAQFLKTTPAESIPLIIEDGQGSAMLISDTLHIYNDQGVMDTSTIPFFLVFFFNNDNTFDPSTSNFFFPAGYALYITEETGLAEGMMGQSCDEWTQYLRQEGKSLPLTEAINLQMRSEDQEEVLRLLTTLTESGSFARWVIETYDLETLQRLISGEDLQSVLKMSIEDAETAWLAALTLKELKPHTCPMITSRGSIAGGLCYLIDPER